MPEKLTDDSPMPFGKHKGKLLKEVPDDYFEWLYTQGMKDGNLKDYVQENFYISFKRKCLTL